MARRFFFFNKKKTRSEARGAQKVTLFFTAELQSEKESTEQERLGHRIDNKTNLPIYCLYHAQPSSFTQKRYEIASGKYAS